MEIRIGTKRGRAARYDGIEERVRDAVASNKARWKSRILRNPSQLRRVEHDVHQVFKRLADEVVAGLLAEVTADDRFKTRAKGLRKQAARPLRSAEPRSLKIRLLGGLALYISTLYCGPLTRTGKGRGSEGSGIYPELGLLHFIEDMTPALASEVSRRAALLPSFEIARRELARTGIEWDIKKVHTMACTVGFVVLTTRKRDLQRWRDKKMPRGTEFKNKRVGVMPDGGRVRLRENFRPQKKFKYKGRHKVRPRCWKAAWREPKLFVIFELDEKGRQKAHTKSYIDGTLQGPDAFMELMAMRFHQLGVVDAKEIVFVADGGTWIWNRLDAVIRLANLRSERVTKVLDFFHASHHIHVALNALGFDEEAHARVYKRQRRQLHRGRVDLLLHELRDYKRTMKPKGKKRKELIREIAYFERHATHMNYSLLRNTGRPMGSGAIESAIRRVLNQRLKGNGIQWNADNVEAIMVLRGLILADRFDETLADACAMRATNRRIDWRWSSPDLRAEVVIPDEEDQVSEFQRAAFNRLARKRA
jgi:hypothetical protein